MLSQAIQGQSGPVRGHLGLRGERENKNVCVFVCLCVVMLMFRSRELLLDL